MRMKKERKRDRDIKQVMIIDAESNSIDEADTVFCVLTKAFLDAEIKY